MAVVVPDKNDAAFGAIMDGFYKFIGNAPIPMDVKSIEDQDSTKKVQVAAKVFVPPTQRLKIRDQVVDYLENRLDRGETWAYEVSANPVLPQFDLILRYQNEEEKKRPQVIRIEVKPVGGGGSGGGAANTKIQEIGMAAFVAIRYREGGGVSNDIKCHPDDPTQCLTTEDYDWGLAQVESKDVVTSEQIQALDQEWKDAFILGANEIYHKVGSPGSGGGWEFVRNDTEIEALISNRFDKVIKDNSSYSKITNEDKWNPSDIWLVSKKEKSKLIKLLSKEETVDCLNNFFQVAFSPVPIRSIAKEKVPNRSLIGVSLKKLGTRATFKPVNQMDQQGLIKRESVKFNKSATTTRLKSFSSMDVYFNHGTSNYQAFQARNFKGTSAGDWKLELKGEHAAHGKIQGSIMRDVLSDAGFTNIPVEPSKDFSKECKTASNKIADKMYKVRYTKSKAKLKNGEVKQADVTDEIYELLSNFNPQGFSKTPNDKQEMWTKIATKDASWRYSKLAGLRLLKFFDDLSQDEANRAMKELYLYASSQSDKSSVYYKLM